MTRPPRRPAGGAEISEAVLERLVAKDEVTSLGRLYRQKVA